MRHAEGELEGLEEFVAATRLVCRWEDWPKLERDEQKERAFYSSLEHRKVDRVVCRAANDLLVDLAIAFAKAEPQTVILYLDLEEAEYLQKGYGDSPFWHRELLKELPAHAVARHWASGAGRDFLREELERVRHLAREACYYLLLPKGGGARAKGGGPVAAALKNGSTADPLYL